MGRQDVSNQIDGQHVGQGLGGEPPPDAAAHQLGIHGRQRGPEMREVQAVDRRDRYPRRIEVERLGSDPRDQPRLQIGVERILGPVPTPPSRSAGRHYRNRSGGGRNVPLHAVVQQVQVLGWSGD